MSIVHLGSTCAAPGCWCHQGLTKSDVPPQGITKLDFPPLPSGISLRADRPSLSEDSDARNKIPMADGLLYYFPNALAAVAEVSRIGNEQHNPGEPMHWARGKSTDHANKVVRHLVDAGKKDSKGVRHTAYAAWRMLALLQEEIERDEGAPLPRNARRG